MLWGVKIVLGCQHVFWDPKLVSGGLRFVIGGQKIVVGLKSYCGGKTFSQYPIRWGVSIVLGSF